MNPAEKLMEIARSLRPHLDMVRLESPNWGGQRWDWEYYIDADIADMWGELPIEAQLLAFIYASKDLMNDEPSSE